jgi:hypothetical protein
MSVEERSWMYEGWNDNSCHSEDWVCNTNVEPPPPCPPPPLP